jgi:chromosome segregation ATPase
MTRKSEALDLQILGDSFDVAVQHAGRVVAKSLDQRDRAYSKLRAYKAQQRGLVTNQRLLKLEYKELRDKYTKLQAEFLAQLDDFARLTEALNKANDALSRCAGAA